MRNITAIALIAIRNAIRSRIVLGLLCGLLLVLIGVPLTLHSDGTLAGHVRLLLRYTLGLATLLLSVATVWAACAAISTEIRDRQIQMVLSKPVRAVEIWLGKWLGLTALNAVLLCVCLAVTYGALRWTTRPGQWPDTELESLRSELLAARQPLSPRPFDVEQEVMQRFQSARASGELPVDLPDAEILPQIERMVRVQRNAIASGEQLQWVFDLPGRPADDQPLIVRYRFSLSDWDTAPLSGRWSAGSADADQRFILDVMDAPRTWHRIALDPGLIAPDGTLTLAFANLDERPISVLFDPEDGVQLMVYQSGFLPNYLRAGLLILFHLAFLAAIGLTAGAFFSVPVAALTSFYALLLLNAGRLLQRMAERDIRLARDEIGRLHYQLAELSRYAYAALNALVQPVYATNPLDVIAAGEWLGWSQVGSTFVIKIVLYSGVLAWLGSRHLARKEVALPL